MHLKRLEMQGFKSFPEKIRLDFNKGITAVVGPNGSGKSNIADAVRWVLGEQSVKSLRGAKMEDIIFSGTENRRPLGFAEVSILLNNSDGKLPLDYTDVTITRRVYRSGESEFFINSSACRLRDVHELFMDTGIGREGYSIIGQGKIEEILSARTEDRRLLFEEAAGITKFRSRRQEAFAKLEREKNNLLRVNDIVSELEAQLEPLREKSEKAKLYLEQREYLKLIQINIFLSETLTGEKEIAKLLNDISNINEQLEAEKEKLFNIKNSHNSLKQLIASSGEELKKEAITLNSLRSGIEKKENDILLLNEQIKHINSNMDRLHGESADKKEELRNKRSEKESELQKLRDTETELHAAKELLLSRQNDFDKLNEKINEREDRHNRINGEINEKMKEVSDTREKLSKTQNIYEILENKKEQLNGILSNIEDKITECSLKIKTITGAVKETENAISARETDISFLVSDRNRIQKLLDAENAENKEINTKLNECASRHKLLTEMSAHYEGYYKSVKTVLKQKKNNPEKFGGICGAVGELLETQGEYELAIEIGLGSAVQNIVTETEDDAITAINYLKKENAGRATFLPITSIKPNPSKTIAPEGLSGENGVIGLAKNLISYEPKYENIFSYLLSNITVVDNVENAAALFKKYNYRFKIVSLSGELFNPGGSITGGGGSSHTTSIFSRGRQIKELQKQIETLENLSAESIGRLKLLNDKIIKNNLLYEQNKNNLQQKKIEQAELNTGLKQLESVCDELLDEKKDHESENIGLMRQIVSTNQDIRKYKNKLNHLEEEVELLRTKLADQQDESAIDKTAIDGKINELMDIKTEIGARGQVVSSIKAAADKLDNEINLTINVIERIDDEIAGCVSRITEKENKIDIIKKEIKNTESDYKSKHERISSLESSIANWQKQLDDSDSAVDDKNQLVSKITTERDRLEIKKEQLEKDRRRLYDSIWDEYNITYKSAQEYKKIEMSLPQLQKEQRNVKNELSGLGDIYVGAIDEYKQVKERYEFLSQQRNDIVEAEDKLNIIISELTSHMESLFNEKLKLISDNFNNVFREMFNGGKAFLKISDESNILESEIIIAAQPPGKTLQNMSLLSGGERALTATALLFGILRLKPSPFCILDEVESALDDANVSRYANYIKSISGSTQFILVTHRKGTMEQADTLYGVTMQEHGVSKLVSVKLDEAV